MTISALDTSSANPASIWAWTGFLLFAAAMLALDLGLLTRKGRETKTREALMRCAAWIALAIAFNVIVLTQQGARQGSQWFASYIVELSLSVDNLFVFILIFTFFKVPQACQHRVLFWGILGAAIMRATFILGGIQLIQHFHWITMIFGAFLLFTAIKLAFPKKGEPNPDKNLVVRYFKKLFPVSTNFDGSRFLTRENGRLIATPLLITLLAIETTDVIFAVDSVPAVLGITKDPFIAFTSNISAILGLRSFYFAFNAITKAFRFINAGIAAILAFTGAKMIIENYHEIGTITSLVVIGGTLAGTIIASLLFPAKTAESPPISAPTQISTA